MCIDYNNNKYNTEKIYDKIDWEADAYKELFMEKFSKVIENNVLLMKDYILGMKRGIQLKGIINLNIGYKENSIEVGNGVMKIKFRFKKQKLKEISYCRRTSLVREKNPIEFAENFYNLTLQDENLEEFIYAMNKIPEKLGEYYAKIEEEAKYTKRNINPHYEKLEQLNVSDL